LTLADLCDVVYALQVDQMQALELAAIAAGAEVVPGDMVDKFETWLWSEPDPVDTERAQLMAALGVSP
jgi:hypothetical protein